MSDVTTDLWYDTRIVIDTRLNNSGVKYDSYVTWKIAKVENVFPVGISKLTMSQDLFDPSKDQFDPDTGFLYANYTSLDAEREDDISSDDSSVQKTATLNTNGSLNLSVGGDGKFVTLTLTSSDGATADTSDRTLLWAVRICDASGTWEDVNIDDYLEFKLTDSDDTVSSYYKYSSTLASQLDYTKAMVHVDSFDYLGGQLELTGRYPNDENVSSTLTFKIRSL